MIEDRSFSLALDEGWRPRPSDDPDTHILVDARRDVTIRLSATAQDIQPGDLDRLAWRLVDLEIEKEISATQVLGHAATIYEPIVMPRPWGRAIAYHGHDASGRRFGFSGAMTCRCTIRLALWTTTLSESGLLAVMDEVASKIVFDAAPMLHGYP
jgi:hypothetical protein